MGPAKRIALDLTRRGADTLLAVAVAAIACSCAEEERVAPPEAPDQPPAAETGPSILLISVDTTRADHLGCYGRELARTPNMDGLAAEGVLFECAQTVAPLTLPAHSSLFTGLYPPRHGVRDNGSFVLPDGLDTMAERLSTEGYRTGAVVASVVLDQRFGLEQGFDDYLAPEAGSSPQGMYAALDADEVTRRAQAWLAADSRPFFLWVHYWDPHQPYAPPPGHRVDGGTPYDGEIHFADEELGKLLDAVQELDEDGRLMTILVSDHGEGFDFKGEPTHSYYPFGPMVRIPMLLRYPDRRGAGSRRREVVSLVDVLPTLEQLLGLSPASGLDGVSLEDVEALRERDGVYVESAYPWYHHRWSPIAGLVTPEARYFHSARPELYLGPADQPEGVDVVAEEEERAAALRGRLLGWLELHPGVEAPRRQLSADMVAQLESMGYLQGVPEDRLPSPVEWSEFPSPLTFRPWIKTFLRTQIPGAPGRAIQDLRELLRHQPEDLACLNQLAILLIQSQRYEEALEPLKRLIALHPHHADALANLGAVHQAARRFDEAIQCYVQALELEPGSIRTLTNLIAILDHLGMEDELSDYREKLSRARGDR